MRLAIQQKAVQCIGGHGAARVQDEMEAGSFKVGTLSSLTSLFVLQHAKEKYGWTPAGAGISESKAAEAAATFGKARPMRLPARPPARLLASSCAGACCRQPAVATLNRVCVVALCILPHSIAGLHCKGCE